MFLRLVASIVLLAISSQGAKILVFICQMAKSHHLVMHPIIRELAARGHEVDFYTHHKVSNAPKTLRHIQFQMFNYDEILRDAVDILGNVEETPLYKTVKSIRDLKASELYHPCHLSKEVKELLASNKTYDLVMGEFSVWQEELSVLIHRFKAIGVTLQTFPDNYWLSELVRLPHNPSYMVSSQSIYSPRMNFLERLSNFWSILLAKMVDYYYVMGPLQWIADKELRYDGWESRPTVFEIASDMALVLTSTHHSLGYPYPSAPHVKEVMGTNVDDNPSPLPKDLQHYMDSAEHGVVYFSMGSIVSVNFLKTSNILNPLLDKLSRLNQKVLWKWTSHAGDEPPDVPNIKFSKWLPQQSVLAHPKLKLFMTHGGLGSLTEAVYHGVPLIASPILGDQIKNVKVIVNLGLGVELNVKNMTSTSITWALDEVLNNPKYKEEMTKRSAMFRDRPMKPLDEAVYWIEYVLRHGKVLQPASLHMPLYQFYLLDVIGLIVVCVGVILFLSCRLLRSLTQVLKNICVCQTPDKINVKKVN